jgi:hypothetical protein
MQPGVQQCKFVCPSGGVSGGLVGLNACLKMAVERSHQPGAIVVQQSVGMFSGGDRFESRRSQNALASCMSGAASADGIKRHGGGSASDPIISGQRMPDSWERAERAGLGGRRRPQFDLRSDQETLF